MNNTKLNTTLNATLKKEFRATKEWKEFRKVIYEKANGIDELTGSPLRKGWAVHHKDNSIENYTKLYPTENFSALNKKSHSTIEYLHRCPKLPDELKIIIDRYFVVTS
jgi:hypothetical protein